MLDEKFLLRAGIAALLPGIRLMKDMLVKTEAEYHEALQALNHSGDLTSLFPAPRRGRPPKMSKTLLTAIAEAVPLLEAPAAEAPKRRGRPPRAVPAQPASAGEKISKAQSSYWENLTPEQRRAEVTRRMNGKKTTKKSKAGLTQRGTHPKQNYGWSGMTAQERSIEMRRRQALARKTRMGAAA